MFAFPILISIIMVLLMVTVFRFDTPTSLKEAGETEKLRILMNKIYHSDEVESRIAAIGSDEQAEPASKVSYAECLTDRRYRVATRIGLTLSAL